MRGITARDITTARLRLPRTKLLPRCLAIALAIGSNASEHAMAQTLAAEALRSDPPALSALPVLPESERQALIDRMRRTARTPPAPPATARVVSNCNDSGPGSYRQAMLDAVSGDTIDMTSLTCSKITLTSGDVSTSVSNLTLQGPGGLGLSIDGNSQFRPLHHIGTGTLTVNDLMIAHGKKYLANGGIGNPNGGCIHSQGSVAMNHVWAKYCDAGSSSTTVDVKGGAVYAKSGLSILNSVVSSSSAHSSGRHAYGGGIYTGGDLTLATSTITGNSVSAASWNRGGGVQVGTFASPGGSALVKYSTISNNITTGQAGVVGGLYATGNVTIVSSTISSNQSAYGGGVAMSGVNINQPFLISNSTISGNQSGGKGSGVLLRGPAKIRNSTIAFNTARSLNANKYGAGLLISGSYAVDLQSTIIARNTTETTSGTQVDDVGGGAGASLTGANNLVFLSALTTPAGTITFKDPGLSALSDHGGPTYTHALSPLSPAINAGNNAAGLATDQRSSGYPRTIGAGTDIGAFELNLADVIFANGFD